MLELKDLTKKKISEIIDIANELGIDSSGKKNEIIFEQAQELYYNRNKEKKSFDTNDFDISFSRGLSLEDGTTTLTEFTGSIIAETISLLAKNGKTFDNLIICGGGRKNKMLMNIIQKNLSQKIKIKMNKY